MRKQVHLIAVASVAALTSCGGHATTGHGPAVDGDTARVRAITSVFRSLDSAVAAGYPREVDRCIDHPELGAMGYHHLNRALLDGSLAVERPEILLYERAADGAYALTGVEYIVPYSVRPRGATPPMIMGRELKRSDALELWYLHAWIWKANPAGLFADWNPEVKCRT